MSTEPTGVLDLLSLLLNIVLAVVPAAGAVVIALRVRGLPRALGVAGCVACLVAALGFASLYLLIPRVAASTVTISLVSMAGTVLQLIGLALLVAAVVVGRPRAAAGSTMVPPPAPNYPPPAPWS